MRPIHIFEIASAGLFAYRAYDTSRRSVEARSDSASLPAGPERRLVERAAESLETDAWINGLLAAGLFGLAAYSWDRPWAQFAPLTKRP